MHAPTVAASFMAKDLHNRFIGSSAGWRKARNNNS